jgi:mono/diheme cytochrome c family protein
VRSRSALVLAITAAGLFAVGGLGGCRSGARFSGPLTLGGKSVAAEILNEGHEVYLHYCYACHGEKGDGQGPAAPAMRPPPRDLTTGTFKFAGVAAGELPQDEDLVQLLKRGLAGTPMLPWDLSDRERNAVVQYLKTLSPRWKTETPGEQVLPDAADPWKGREQEAMALGEAIYHLTGVVMDKATNMPKMVLAGCNACHPSYLATAELEALSQRTVGKPATLRENLHRPSLKETEYKVGATKITALPTDFLFHNVKNGDDPLALFRTIAAGIGGTAMPTWKGSLKDADLWALVHYTRRLISLRDTGDGDVLRQGLVPAATR